MYIYAPFILPLPLFISTNIFPSSKEAQFVYKATDKTELSYNQSQSICPQINTCIYAYLELKKNYLQSNSVYVHVFSSLSDKV